MSRLPLPSRWTLLVEFVIVSISPVPKLEPGPVSYIHCESTPLPDAPLKSSLNTVDQPEGGPGTAAGTAMARVAGAAGAATAEADGARAAVSAITGAMTTRARAPLKRHLVARFHARTARCDLPGMPGLLNPAPGLKIGNFPIFNQNVTLRFCRVNRNNG